MIIGVFVFLPAANAEEISSEEAQMVSTASGALAQIMSISENAIPESLLQKAQAVAVIPNVIKAGFIVGGRYGKGVLVTREDDGTWSRPAFISLTGASVGWQLGAQSTDIVLVFTDKAALQGVEDGKLTLGAQASVAAGPVGRTAEVGTDVRLDSAVYS